MTLEKQPPSVIFVQYSPFFPQVRTSQTFNPPGVDVNSAHKMNGWTALHWAVFRSRKEAVDLLLSKGADPFLKNSEGQIPSELVRKEEDAASFTPNYLAYPEFSKTWKSIEEYQRLTLSGPSSSTPALQTPAAAAPPLTQPKLIEELRPVSVTLTTLSELRNASQRILVC
jgi:hypothetical protein